MLAEIGLTLANVNLEAASRFIPEQRPRMRRAVRATIRSLAKRCADAEAAPASRRTWRTRSGGHSNELAPVSPRRSAEPSDL